MSSRPSPQVLRRRRVGGLAVLAVLGWLVYSGVVALIGIVDPPSQSATKAKTTDCLGGVVSVNAYVGDGEKRVSEFNTNTKPELWFDLTNNGKVTCYFNAGPKVQFYTIKVGEEMIWTNEQCDRAGLKDQRVTLKPGKALKAFSSPWYRVYSSDSGCGEGQIGALPGTYSFSVKVNQVTSMNSEIFTIQ